MRTSFIDRVGDVIQHRLRLWHILALALVLRIAWSALVPIRPVSDSLAYDELAGQLALGNGYKWINGTYTAYWPVGTSSFYGFLYAIFGKSMWVVAAANCLLGALLTAATYGLARTHFSKSTALLSGLAIAIWPTWIAFTTIISSELLTNVVFVTGMAVALYRPWPIWARTVAGTILLTAAAYCRANMLPFVILIPALAAIDENKPRQIFPRVMLAMLVGAALITPWALRNKAMLGAAAPISTNFGVNLWIGNNPQANGGYIDPPALGLSPLPQNEIQRDKAYQQAAIAFIKSHPIKYIELSVSRVRLTLDRETFGVLWNERSINSSVKAPLKVTMTLFWYLALIGAVVGIFLYIKRRPLNIFSPFILVPAGILATPILVMANERYHYPIAPFVAVFLAYALSCKLHTEQSAGELRCESGVNND